MNGHICKHRRLTNILVWTAAIFFAYGAHVCASAQENATYRIEPFPHALKRYDTEFFRLVNPSFSTDPQTAISYYDQNIAKQFDAIVTNFIYLDPKLKR